MSHTLDTLGPMTRTIEDCALIDAAVTGRLHATPVEAGLKEVRIGYVLRQHLDLIDADVERAFKLTLEKLKASGAQLVEIDLGDST